MSKKRQSAVSAAKKRTLKRTPEDMWQRNPEIIKKFLQIRLDYEQLCAEVEYILRKRITERGIETSSIVSRAKTLKSFLEKLQRKHYGAPFEQLTDLAGARIVCLYRSDIAQVAEIIRGEFVIVEDIDKLDELGVDQFGYGARHFTVRLGKSSSGARYDDLKHLPCEVQVRTVVQDAWAIIQHHLVYKRESQIPSQLQRKLNSLAGLFETVDDQFERIREERETYLAEVRQSIGRPDTFLENELNLDSFKEYLKWRFPGRAIESWDGQARSVLDGLVAAGYKTLREADEIIDKTNALRDPIFKELPSVRKGADGTVPACLDAALALGLSAPNWQTLLNWGTDLEKLIKRHRS
jgi:putative GTP pyrophosphokinase